MKKILAIRNDRFGEFILNIPAFRALKESAPGVELHVVVAPQVEELARAVPSIDRVWTWPPGPHPIFEEIAFVKKLRKEKFDQAVVLNPSRHSHHFIFWAGIPVRCGYGCKHGLLLTHKYPEVPGRLCRHEVENNLELVALIGAQTTNKALELMVPDQLKATVRGKFRLDFSQGMVAVHPWTSDSCKQWPLENFEKLVAAIAKGFSGRILILGRPERWHREINLTEHPYVIDLKNATTLMEAAAIISQCRCLVSCDSGPVHLASAVHTPAVALFRNDTPGKTPDRWGPWGDRHVVIQKYKLDDILVKDVFEKMEPFLRG